MRASGRTSCSDHSRRSSRSLRASGEMSNEMVMMVLLVQPEWSLKNVEVNGGQHRGGAIPPFCGQVAGDAANADELHAVAGRPQPERGGPVDRSGDASLDVGDVGELSETGRHVPDQQPDFLKLG